MTAATPAWVPPRGIGWRTRAALFLALVGAILGAVPGWTLCFAAWLVLSWLVLGCVVVLSMFLVFAAMIRNNRVALRTEGRQVLSVVVLMFAMLPMGMLSTGVEFAQARADLRERADASARAGGPRLAMTPIAYSDWLVTGSGFVYDPGGELAKPASSHPAAWKGNPVLAELTDGCLTMTHFIGAYSRWSNACDGS